MLGARRVTDKTVRVRAVDRRRGSFVAVNCANQSGMIREAVDGACRAAAAIQ